MMDTSIFIDMLRFVGKTFNKFFFSANSIVAKLFAAILYVIVYDVLYRDFIVFFFSYMGLEYITMTMGEFLLWIVLSVIPFFFYKGVTCISSLFSLLIYLFVYIPVVHGLFVTYGVSFVTEVIYSSVLCLFVSSFFSISPEKPLFKQIEFTFKIKKGVVEIMVLVLTLFVVVIRKDSIHFVNILTERELLYSLRVVNSESLSGSLQILAYIQGWLLYAFYPFLLVTYLTKKSWIKALLVVGGYLVMFMIDMQKLTLLLPLPMLFMYFILNKREKQLKYYTHGIIISTILILSFFLLLTKDNELMFEIGCIILLRTVCVSGWLTQLYIHFFADNPFTSYGHVSFVNSLLHNYPYGNVPLGYVVSYGSQNANANFILTDGYAAAGLMGIIFICTFFYVFMQFLNSITERHGLVPSFVILIPTLALFLNISLFTTFISNGLFFLILLFMISGTSSPEEAEVISQIESNK